jgi:hypothetical protein
MHAEPDSFTSTQELLQAGICLLALLTERPQDLGQVETGHQRLCVEYSEDTLNDAEKGVASDDEGDTEELELIDTEDDVGEQLYLISLPTKLLDRLAEMLARFNTDQKEHDGPILDAKHVSATMIVISITPSRVRICCV